MAKRTAINIIKQPPKASVQYKIVRDEVRLSLQKVGRQGEKAFNRVVANWTNKPVFKSQVGIGQKQLFFRIRIQGSQFVVDNWHRIDITGRKPQRIFPKKAKALRFVWGGKGSYRAKTGANPARFGGSGTVANGKIVFRKFIDHPGFKPRKFSVAIKKDIDPVLRREIRNGYRRGLRRVNR